jgi:hypothetical protein
MVLLHPWPRSRYHLDSRHCWLGPLHVFDDLVGFTIVHDL